MLALEVAASPRACAATRRRSGDLGSRPSSAAQREERQPLALVKEAPARRRTRVAAALLASTLLSILLLYSPWASRHGAGTASAHAHDGLPASCTPADAATRARLFSSVRTFPGLPGANPVAAGLLLAVGFHRSAAVAAAAAAAAADPTAALPRWALAYAHGPGGNRAAVPDDNAPFPAFTPGNWSLARAHARAAAAAGSEDPFTASLIAATAEIRFAPGSSPADVASWARAEAAFAGAMEKLAATPGLSPPAASFALALAAEATATPVQWAAVEGERLVDAAATALALVRRALDADTTNPLALHLAIHLTEALPPTTPASAADRALGLAAAKILAGPGPWADAPIPHLLHMSSHAFARAGRWRDAVRAGRRALAADTHLASACVESYAVEHNAAALAHAADLGGDKGASAAAAAFAASAPDKAGPALAYAGETREATLSVWRTVLFADWGALRSLPPLTPRSRGLCLVGGRAWAGAARAWGQGMAAAARVARAEAGGRRDASTRAALATAVAALDAAIAAVPPEPITVPGPPPGLYSCGHETIAPRLARVVAARVAVLDGDFASAARTLTSLADEEAADPYMEPPRTPFPARPCAGWAAVKAGDLEGAEAQFRADLAERPHHARSLVGLASAARARGDGTAAAAAEAEARRAWAGRRLPPSACPAFSEAG